MRNPRPNHAEFVTQHTLKIEFRQFRENENPAGAASCIEGAPFSVKRVHFATIRPCGTSTSSTPRKENRSFTRYVGGVSETWRTIVPTASVTAAWKITAHPHACRIHPHLLTVT